jgi:hypothetical protein
MFIQFEASDSFPQDQKNPFPSKCNWVFSSTFSYNQLVKSNFSLIHLSLFLCFLGGSLAWADGEQMGSFRFSEFSLSPRVQVQEPSQGGFELKESWIGFEWSRDQSLNSLSGEFSFGTGDLVAPAIWYPAKALQVELVTAALQAKTQYIDVRAGLIPVTNGYEGSVPEWELMLPETRTRNHRWFTRRDFGVEFKTERKPYVARVSIHNGESAANADQNMWVTGMWSYLNSSGFGLLTTAEVGRTDARSTANSTAPTPLEGFDFDPLLAAKIRHGTLAVYRKWNRHLVLAEMGRGEILQSDQKHPFGWGHLDVSANLGGDLNVLLRYEQSQPNLNLSTALVKSTGMGLSISSKDRLSAVTIWANHHEQNPERQDDEALLIFRLNSNYL